MANIHADTNLDGDKVLIQVEERRRRGVLIGTPDDTARVRCDDNGQELTIPSNAILRNFTLAWRRATRHKTQRAAQSDGSTKLNLGGRPPTGKQSITLRVRSDIWNRLGEAVAAGLIVSREETINTLLESLVTILQPQLAQHTDTSSEASTGADGE